ncbi:MAG: type II secretion system F family protein [Isosphaeraceae bacterium]
MTRAEAARLTGEISGLTRAGLPLGPGLAALAGELPRGRLRSSVEGLSRALERGEPLAQALEEQHHRIPPHLRGLVLGGLKSGRLGDILGRFSAYMAVGTELKRRLWLSLAYPLVSIAAAVALFLFIHVVVVAMFETIFLDFGIALPRMTVGMVMVSRGVRMGWPVVLILVVAALSAWILVRIFMSAAGRRSLATRIPLIGGVWRYISWAEFCHLLALLLESRLPLPQALRLAGEGVQDADLDRACLRMAEDVEGGSTLATAMLARPELPMGLPRMLRWAGSKDASAEILHMTGEMFEARAKSQAIFAGTVMAVIAVVLVLWVVFGIIGGLMLPMVTLISRLSG